MTLMQTVAADGFVQQYILGYSEDHEATVATVDKEKSSNTSQ